MTNTDQFDEIEIKDDSTPVRHLNAQYRIPEPRKAGISVSPIRHPGPALLRAPLCGSSLISDPAELV